MSGKVHADIAQRGRPQQRIGDGVGKHIGVGMALQSEFGGNDDAAQNQRPAARDAMNVPALACAEVAQDPVTQEPS